MKRRTLPHATAMLLLFAGGGGSPHAVAQVPMPPAQEPQMRLHVELPPQQDPSAHQCPDTGSFVVVGPTVRRGEPIQAQSWNDCADLPRRGSTQQPLIGVEIPVMPFQGRPRPQR
jgi:hypothetical protein